MLASQGYRSNYSTKTDAFDTFLAPSLNRLYPLFDGRARPAAHVSQWCPPCKMLDPILQKVLTAEIEGENEVDYMKINTDNETDLAAKYKVSPLCKKLCCLLARAYLSKPGARLHRSDIHTMNTNRTFILLEISVTCPSLSLSRARLRTARSRQ